MGRSRPLNPVVHPREASVDTLLTKGEVEAFFHAIDREYEELVRFTVSASEDVVTLVILEELPSLLHVDLGDFLTFTIDVPAETAEALRDPSRFLE